MSSLSLPLLLSVFVLLLSPSLFLGAAANKNKDKADNVDTCYHPVIANSVIKYVNNADGTFVDKEDCTPSCGGFTDGGCSVSVQCAAGYELTTGSTSSFQCKWLWPVFPSWGVNWNFPKGVQPACVLAATPTPAKVYCNNTLTMNDGGIITYNSTLTPSGYPVNTRAVFSCDQSSSSSGSYLDLHGGLSNVTYCTSTGHWAGTPPICTPTDSANYTNPGSCVPYTNYTTPKSSDPAVCTTFLTSPFPYGIPAKRSTCCNDPTKNDYGLCATSSNCNGMQFMVCNGGNCPDVETPANAPTLRCKTVKPSNCGKSSNGKCWGVVECPTGTCPLGHFGKIYPGQVCIADGSGNNNVVDANGYLSGNIKICGSCGGCPAPNVIVDSAGHCCPNINYVWDVTTNRCKLSGAKGDPQFTGFLGQDFQVHGTSNTIYNIISTPSFQYNALFTYLTAGKCRVGTQCFSHPGNYFGSVGITIRDEQGEAQKLLINSGPVDAGLKVSLNHEIELEVSEHELKIGKYTISLPNPFEFVIESDEFNMKVENSDMFLNQDVSIGRGLVQQISEYRIASRTNPAAAAELELQLPHGILGQTWINRKHNNRWKYIQGQLFDYIVQDSIFGKQFKFNRF